jgi:hypothetical protein
MLRSAGIARGTLGCSVVLVLLTAATASGHPFSAWVDAVDAQTIDGNSTELNTTSLDGCPIQSPDGLGLYIATNRPGGHGGIDIWVAWRASTEGSFGDPVNLGEPINSAADDFCPTPVRGKGLFFVSTRATAGACGGADIYFAREDPAKGWTTPLNLGCAVNSAGAEAGPSYFADDGQAYLYFSSGPDIMASAEDPVVGFGAAVPVAELNTAAGEFRPNVRKDGLEIVFDSNRDGTAGGQDLYFATRSSVDDPWGTPFNGGAALNTPANETRGSFSWDGSVLYFGRSPGPEGSTDIFVSRR